VVGILPTLSDPSDISPCGNYRIVRATYEAAKRVLDDLSHLEIEERERFGLEEYGGSMEQVLNGNAWMVTVRRGPDAGMELGIFGVSDEFYAWALPSETCAREHKRALASRRWARWVVTWMFSLVKPGPDGRMPYLINGVSPEAKALQHWLKDVAGARIFKNAIPSQTNGHPVHPFVFTYGPDYV
jgi:hypothetical protein